MNKYTLTENVILRKEYFGGIAFNRDNATTLQVDEELYAVLLALVSSKNISEVREYLQRKPGKEIDVRQMSSCLSKLVKLGFVSRDENNSNIVYTPNEIIDGCLSAPEMVHLAITNKCNVNCSFCYVKRTGSDMNTEQIMTLIDNLSEMKVFQIAIGGGEPFLRDDLLQIIRYCKKKGIIPNITSNGQLLDKPVIKELAGIVGQVNLSVNECLDSKTDYSKKICMLNDEGVRTGVNLMVSHKNIGTIEKTIAELVKLPIQNIVILRPKPTQNISWYYENRLIQDDLSLLKPIIMRYPDIIRVDCSLVCLMRDVSPEVLKYKSVFGCVGGVRFCTIRNNGDVYPCSFFNGKEYMAGNVLSSDLRDIWKNAEIFKKFRTMNNKITGKCKDCTTRDLCKGCRRIALEEKGDFYSEDICVV